jgi:hypothetical protein
LIAQCFQRNPSKRPDAKALLNGLLLNHSIGPGTDAVSTLPEKTLLVEPSNSSVTFSPKQADGVESLDLQDASMLDSLCYSLTLPVGKHTKNVLDTSDWPDWAKQSYQLASSSRPKSNPFARS